MRANRPCQCRRKSDAPYSWASLYLPLGACRGGCCRNQPSLPCRCRPRRDGLSPEAQTVDSSILALCSCCLLLLLGFLSHFKPRNPSWLGDSPITSAGISILDLDSASHQRHAVHKRKFEPRSARHLTELHLRDTAYATELSVGTFAS